MLTLQRPGQKKGIRGPGLATQEEAAKLPQRANAGHTGSASFMVNDDQTDPRWPHRVKVTTWD